MYWGTKEKVMQTSRKRSRSPTAQEAETASKRSQTATLETKRSEEVPPTLWRCLPMHSADDCGLRCSMIPCSASGS